MAVAIQGLSSGALEVLVDDPHLRITQRKGRGSRAVVSFAGVGQGLAGRGAPPREEFRASLLGQDAGELTCLFVVDRRRTWYNGVYDRLREILTEALRDSDDIVTLGNSMGGFGALRFGSLLPACRRAIAFAPQFAVHPAHIPPGERRWPQYRVCIASHVLGHALEGASDEREYWIFFGGGEGPDNAHAECFARHRPRRAEIFHLGDAGHDVARKAREAGVLSPLLARLLEPAAVSRAGIVSLLSPWTVDPADRGRTPGRGAMPAAAVAAAKG